MDHHLRVRNEVDNNQNMNMAEVLDENGRLRDANSRRPVTVAKDRLHADCWRFANFETQVQLVQSRTCKDRNRPQSNSSQAVDYERLKFELKRHFTFSREIKDFSQRYGLFNELKDKITQGLFLHKAI